DRQIPYIRVATPVSSDVEQSNIAGVIQFDVRVTPLIEAVRSAAADLLDDQTAARAILVDEQGRILIDTSSGGISAERALAEGRAPQFAADYPDLNARISA